MKATLFAALIAAALLATPTYSIADKKPEKEKAEKKDKQKDKQEEKKVESPWSEDELSAFLKSGLKVTYAHKDMQMAMEKGLVVNLEVEVLESTDKNVKFKLQDYNVAMATGKVVVEHIDIEHTGTWDSARNGLYMKPINFGAKLETSSEKLKIDGKSYDCTVYASVVDDDQNSEKWWVSRDLPGLVLKYEETGTMLAMGAMRRSVLTTSVATKLEIPKDSKQPGKKKK